MGSLLHFLIMLLCIALAAQVCGLAFSYLKQPSVIGEIISGIMLGPSLLGKFFPSVQHAIFPENSIQFMGLFAQLGIVLYMFVVGLELDFTLLKRSGKAILSIAYAGMIIPFACGMAMAYLLFDQLAEPGVGLLGFALFVGVSISITAFPVLARILDDSGLRNTQLGSVALACAAVGDATAWCGLAAIVSLVKAEGSGAFTPVLLTSAFILGMIFLVRPAFAHVVKWYDSIENTSQGFMILVACALLSAVATEWIGIHAIFGGFFFGAVLPHDSKLTKATRDRLEDLVKVLFLPAFFAFTGMRTETGLISGAHDWLICIFIVGVASTTKFLGAYWISRRCGYDQRNAGALGILLNARGLVELIVLNVGLDLGVISPRLFTMLVVMALVTTAFATPLTLILLRSASDFGGTDAHVLRT